MEYWIQLHIEQGGSVIDAEENHQAPVNNWLLQDSPMLADIPQDQLQSQQQSTQIHYVDQIKFGQDDDGYFLQTYESDIRLQSGDTIQCHGVHIRVTITKRQTQRHSLIPKDFISDDIHAFHQHHAEKSVPALHHHFAAPMIQDEGSLVYDDMRDRNIASPKQAPLEGLDACFHDAFERPFESRVPVHQQGQLTRKDQQGSVSKLKKLLWGDQYE